MTPPAKADATIERTIRRESARLKAALIAHLGTHQFALAEDVAQDAMLAALTNWQADMPEQPGAWLRRVAKNRAIDILRRRAREAPIEWAGEPAGPLDTPDFHGVEDAELRLLYLSCQPGMPAQDQVVLALHLAAGFTAADIATLLTRPRSTVAQRLVRLKRKLRSSGPLTELTADAVGARTDVVLRVLYLMFCAGYLPASGNLLVREDIVAEALRLAELLAQGGWCGDADLQADANALCALFCLQASRLGARAQQDGFVPLSRQNRQLWDEALLARASAYVIASQQTERVSRYHLETAIAVEHASATSFEATRWDRISLLYAQLEQLTSSPVVTVSSALATCYADHPDEALARLEKIAHDPAMGHYPPYFAALAEVHERLGQTTEAQAASRRAGELQGNDVLRAHIDARYAALS